MRLHVLVSVIFSSVIFGQTYTISTIAGGVPPDNTPSTSAGLGSVQGVAVDSARNVFLLSGYTVFRLDAVTGTLSRIAGNGAPGFSGDNGPAINAQIDGFYNGKNGNGLGVDSAGNLYIAGPARVRKIQNGVITTVAGNGAYGFSGDNGPAISAQLGVLGGLAADSAGNLYIADGSRIRKVSNGVITTVAGNGTYGFSGDGGPATSAQIDAWGVAVGSGGNIYIASGNRTIRKVSNGVITTVAGTGTASGELAATPHGIAVDSNGNLYVYVADQEIRIQKVSNGVVTTVAGNGSYGFSGDGGPATSAQLGILNGIAVDFTGSLYFADANRLRKVSSEVISTVAGSSGDDHPATSIQLNGSAGVAMDSAGNLYFAEPGNHRIRKISNGMITTVAGTGTLGFSGDNGPATGAQLSFPRAVAVDSAGGIYIADSSNYRIRKVSNGVITTVAGNGTYGFSGDGGPATNAQFKSPDGVALDSAGTIYVADSLDSRVRKVQNGVVTTVAGDGTYGFSGDNGPAISAQLRGPSGLAVDSASNLYIADSSNYRIRKVSNGVIATVVGSGTTYGYGGDNGPAVSAQLSSLGGVALDSAGSLYIADSGNYRIRRVSHGVIATVAGTGTSGFSGDNGPATSAQLNSPSGMAVDSTGQVYVSDSGNLRVRVLTPAFASKNSASYSTDVLAPDMIAYGETSGIASELIVAPGGFWPTSLGGVNLEITDSQGQKLLAPIYFVTTNAIGYLIPAGTALGLATVKLTTSTGATITGTFTVDRVSPGLFTANANGSGVPAGFWIRAAADGTQTQGYLFDPAQPVGGRVPVAVDLGASSDQVFLSLYGTGFRGGTQATATVGGVTVPVSGFVAVGVYQGEDVVNIGPLPRSIAGRGEVNVALKFDGKSANTAIVNIR